MTTPTRATLTRWYVQSRDGWCAAAVNRKPSQRALCGSVATRCGFFVCLPMGVEKRRPTCAHCLAAALRSTEGKSR